MQFILETSIFCHPIGHPSSHSWVHLRASREPCNPYWDAAYWRSIHHPGTTPRNCRAQKMVVAKGIKMYCAETGRYWNKTNKGIKICPYKNNWHCIHEFCGFKLNLWCCHVLCVECGERLDGTSSARHGGFFLFAPLGPSCRRCFISVPLPCDILARDRAVLSAFSWFWWCVRNISSHSQCEVYISRFYDLLIDSQVRTWITTAIITIFKIYVNIITGGLAPCYRAFDFIWRSTSFWLGLLAAPRGSTSAMGWWKRTKIIQSYANRCQSFNP